MSAIAISLPDSPQTPLPPLRSMKLSVNQCQERSDKITNVSGQVTSVITDPKGKGKQHGHGAGEGPDAGMASPPLAYNAGFGFGGKPIQIARSDSNGNRPENGNEHSNAAKRSISDAWQGDENTQPRQDGGKSGPSTSRNSSSHMPTRHSSSAASRNSESSVLSAASKKSMMDGLGGPTEYEPSFGSARGSFQTSTPLNFGSSVPPMLQGTNHFPMMPSGHALDPRWQFGQASSSASASSAGIFDPTYALGYPGSSGLGGISNSYFGRQISSNENPSSASGSGSGSEATTSATSLFSSMSPSSLPPYTVVTFGSGATAKQIGKGNAPFSMGRFPRAARSFPRGLCRNDDWWIRFLGAASRS